MDADVLLRSVGVLFSAVGGSKLLVDVASPIHDRLAAVRQVAGFCHESRSFSHVRFRLAAMLVLRCVQVLAFALVASAIVVVTLFVGEASQWTFLGGIGDWLTVRRLLIYAGLALMGTVIGNTILAMERRVSWRPVRRAVGVAEQTLADRIRRGDEGLFRVDDDRCEQLAEAIHTKLRSEPEYISGALLTHHGDPVRLSNELVLGGLLEGVASREHPGLGGDWSAFRPIQNYKWKGDSILSGEVLRRERANDVATAIGEFFAGRGITLSRTVQGLMGDLMRRLKGEFDGDASRIFRLPQFPRNLLAGGMAVGAGLYAIAAAVSHFALHAQPWPVGTGSWPVVLVRMVALLIGLGVAIALIIDPEKWRAWCALKLGVTTEFEIVQDRLRGLRRFGEREGMRRAQSKFAWEFGLFAGDSGNVPVGSQKALLVSLKTGALVVLDAERVSGGDQDLWTFGELSIRSVGSHLRRLHKQDPIYDSTDGQYEANNTVDGFLHRVGYKFCQSRGCANVGEGEVCPFFTTTACDVVRPGATQEWRFEGGPNVFSLRDRTS